MNLTLRVWRQSRPDTAGRLESYSINDISEEMSLLEMLDLLNEQLQAKNEEPVAFDHDCREGICGTCSLTIDGVPHGPDEETTTCQVHMRRFVDGATITIEPFRATAFRVIKDLVIDRSAFDRIIQAGGYVSVRTGGTADANAVPISKLEADLAMDFAACIGCGACVAACKNGSASLFTAAKVAQLAHLPQGQAERHTRVIAMVQQMDAEGFGSCTNTYECEAVCPKAIPARVIAEMNRDYLMALMKGE